MANNAQKTHFAAELNKFAQQKVISAMERIGRNLPCKVKSVTGSIVTVTFELHSNYTLDPVTMPYFGPEYVRYPVQIGDLGVTVAIDTYLGGISGLGGGTADLRMVSNLSALFFMPVASTNWSMSEDPNAVVIYGPNGAIIRTVDKSVSVTIAPAGTTVKGGLTVTQLITGDTDAKIGAVPSYVGHTHPVGGGNTGPPNT